MASKTPLNQQILSDRHAHDLYLGGNFKLKKTCGMMGMQKANI